MWFSDDSKTLRTIDGRLWDTASGKSVPVLPPLPYQAAGTDIRQFQQLNLEIVLRSIGPARSFASGTPLAVNPWDRRWSIEAR